MKNVLVLGVAALALVGCAKKEEAAPATAADPCATVTTAQPDNNAPLPTGEVSKECAQSNADAPAVVVEGGGQAVVGGPTSSEPAKEPTVAPAK